MTRYAGIIGVKPEKLEEYQALHAKCWRGVLDIIHECNIRNYTIFHHSGTLFSYYEYIGEDHDSDMAKMASYPLIQQWWQLTAPCQEPLATCDTGQWWSQMQEVFHTD